MKNKLPPPAIKYRITLAELDQLPDVSGVYILAYMGKVLYVGKAKHIPDRIRCHFTNAHKEVLGSWIRTYDNDWHNIRLDVLEAPFVGDEMWMTSAENALVKIFNPLFNTHLLPEKTTLIAPEKFNQLNFLEYN
jgi:excinuclease UvrABC nuclease subunit